MIVMSNSIAIGSAHFRMIETGKHSLIQAMIQVAWKKKWSGRYLDTWPVATALRHYGKPTVTKIQTYVIYKRTNPWLLTVTLNPTLPYSQPYVYNNTHVCTFEFCYCWNGTLVLRHYTLSRKKIHPGLRTTSVGTVYMCMQSAKK